MQIAIVIAICIAFSCSTTIYAEEITQPVISNNSSSSEYVSTNSSLEDSNSTDTQKLETLVGNQNHTRSNTTEHEEAGVVNNSQRQNSADSLNNNSAKEEIKAAGTTVSKNSATFDLKSIKNAASRVKSYIETNRKLPSYVVISNYNLTMSEFLYLLAKGIAQMNSGKTTKFKSRRPL